MWNKVIYNTVYVAVSDNTLEVSLEETSKVVSDSGCIIDVKGRDEQSLTWMQDFKFPQKIGKWRKLLKDKGRVFYGQEPPSEESTTTECGVNYQLLVVIYWNRPIGNL